MALTANDPLNDQRERKMERQRAKWLEGFPIICMLMFYQFLMGATFSLREVGTECVSPFFLICR